MIISTCLTRRRLVLSVAGIVALAIDPARAQLAVDEGCTVDLSLGLLQLNPDCLLTPLGSALVVSPPAHLVSLAQSLDAGRGDGAAPEGFIPQAGSRRRRKKARLRKRRQRKNGNGGGKDTTTPTSTPTP